MEKTIFDNIDPEVYKRVQSLRLIDDDLMTVVFSGDIKATEFLIRILLNRNDLTVTKSMTQLEKHNLFGRSVRLDIVAEDIFKTEYNIEIQRAVGGAGAKRIRYHQAMLDSHTLQKQKDFSDLPNLYIIFILEHDLFNKNEPFYLVNKTLNIKNDRGEYLPFDDGCNIMYINGDYRGDDALGRLMHDFATSDADQMYFGELASKVKYHKQDSKGVETMCQIVEEYGDERAAEAAQQKAIEAAKAFLADGKYTAEEISALLQIPVESFAEPVPSKKPV